MSLVEFLARRISQWNDDCDAIVAFFESVSTNSELYFAASDCSRL